MIRVSEDVGPDVGKCDQKQTSWYFNSESEMCEEFSYSGCGGNRNRFTSSDECYQHCGVSKYSSLLELRHEKTCL